MTIIERHAALHRVAQFLYERELPPHMRHKVGDLWSWLPPSARQPFIDDAEKILTLTEEAIP